MPDREYIVSVIGDGSSDGAWRPSISDVLTTLGLNWSAIDMRTGTQQASNSGKMLILVFDVSDEDDEVIVLIDGTSLFAETASKISLVARIGTESTDAPFTPGEAGTWMREVHRDRRAKFLEDRTV